MRRASVLALMAALLTVSAASAQGPPRDTRPIAAAATRISISGRVLAEGTGVPLRRAIVRLSSSDLAKTRSTRTDASGRYVFTNLPPRSSFTVSAAKPQYLRLEYGQRRPFEAGRPVAAIGASLTAVDFHLPRAGAIAGTVLDNAGEPIDEMWVFARRRRTVDGRPLWSTAQTTVTNDAGQFRLSGLPPGDYYVVARERATPTEVTDEPTGYATTFYPGTTDERQAQPIRLAIGQEVINLDLAVAVSRTATILGQVVDVNGKPAPFSTRVMLLDSTASGTGGNISGGAIVQFDGRFRISGVRPGTYQLLVRQAEQGEALLPIEVADGEMLGLTLVMGSGATVTGRVVSASGDALPFAPVRVELSAQPLTDPWHVRGNARASVGQEWSAQWAGLTGPRLFRATKLPDGWWMKAVMRGGEDVTDAPITLNNGDAVRDLSIVLDDHPTMIDGGVRNARDAAVGDCTVILFADDAARWGPESRFVRAVRPSDQNQFRIEGLPPGVYLAVAVDYAEQGQWLETQFLESLRPFAATITLSPGEHVTLHPLLAAAK